MAKLIIIVWLLGVILTVGLTVAVVLSVTETVGLGLMLALAVGDSVCSGAIAVLFLNAATAAIIPATIIKISNAFFMESIYAMHNNAVVKIIYPGINFAASTLIKHSYYFFLNCSIKIILLESIIKNDNLIYKW